MVIEYKAWVDDKDKTKYVDSEKTPIFISRKHLKGFTSIWAKEHF